MRIAIDATPLLVASAGIKTYLYHWITHLRRIAGGKAEIQTFPPLGPLGPLHHERSQASPLRTFYGLAQLHLLNYGHLSPGWLMRADVFHACKILTPPRGMRLSTTVHDLTCWTMPEFHTAANVRAELHMAERVWKKADGLIAISEYTKSELVRILGIPADRIRVIYNGVDEAYFQVTQPQTEAVRTKLGLPRNYVLFVGTIEPRKNLDAALDAYAALPPSLREEFPFVIAGPVGWAESKTVRRIQAGADGVRYLGYVAESDLPGLTAGASVLFYPSLHEGFGLPVAQAMACGVPVLTSNVSALPEVAGEGAVLADPRSVSEIRSGLEKLLLGSSLREQCGAAGRRRAELYHWDEAARQALRFFGELTARA